MKKYIWIFFLILLGIRALPQAIYSANPDSATLFPVKHGNFENYAFVLDGKVICQQALVNSPKAKLNNVFPYSLRLDGQDYSGAVYFHTEEKYAPPARYPDTLAYFINGRQVDYRHFCLSKAEAYKQIEKSARDTTINGRLYSGSIHVHTDEDFFATRIGLPEVIEKYTGLPSEQVIVHWRSSAYQYTYEENLGTIINDRFPIYSFHIGGLGVKAIEVDRVRFAEGERYVVHLVDNGYRWREPKTGVLFEDPLAVDTIFPCYLTDFDPADNAIFTHTEITAQPYLGKEAYLKRLSGVMGLPADVPVAKGILDSVSIQFIVLRDGMLTALECTDADKSGHEALLKAIKRQACVWKPAIQNGRHVAVWRKIRIFFRRDKKGNICFLDSLEDRYDVVKPSSIARHVEKPLSNDSATLADTTIYDGVDNYTFIVNGEKIKQATLIDYPQAKLDRVIPYHVYFHTPWYPPSPPEQYADDPAYFINNIQVSPYAIRSSRAEEYLHIERSGRDTLIDGALYKGSVCVYTDEDFFADRTSLPEIIKKYTGLLPEQVIVHWHGNFIDALNPGAIIHDRFHLYYINPKGLQGVKVHRIAFAEGDRYLVQLVDQGYRYSNLTDKGWRASQWTPMIFDNPHTIDPAGPCYVTDFDTTGKTILNHAKEEPKPFGGETAYLKKLSVIMGLSVDKPNSAITRDSITLQFIVLGNGKLTALESPDPYKVGHEAIVQAIKQHSCVWSVAWSDRRPRLFRRKMVLFYSRDKKGNIGSLDTLEYRYDDSL